MATFVLSIGTYQYQRNILATANVKAVAKKFVEIIEEDGYGNYSKHPYIEIFHTDEATDYPEVFSEKIYSEAKLIKHLSKLARQLETGETL